MELVYMLGLGSSSLLRVRVQVPFLASKTKYLNILQSSAENSLLEI